MARRSKIIFCLLLAFLYVVVNICPLKAEALPDVMSGSTTLADNIMTYYALSGSAVANNDWINTLYNSYGSSFGTIEELANQGYLVMNDAGYWEPVQQLSQMIEQAPAYSSLGLNEVFKVTAEDVANGGGLAAASGASILAGSLGGVASTGVVPVLGGVTAAYWGGIGLGTLIANKLDLYGKVVSLGLPIDTSPTILDYIPNDSNIAIATYEYSKYSFERIVTGPVTFAYYTNDPYGYIGAVNLSNDTVESKVIEKRTTKASGAVQITENTNNLSQNQKVESGITFSGYTNIDIKANNFFNDQASFNSAFDRWKLGTGNPNYGRVSPDMIGEDGNLDGSYNPNTQKYTIPDMKPQIDPGTQAGKPLTLPEWLSFANGVQNNNNNVNPTPDGNQGLFQDILDLIKTVNPSPDPNPNPDPWSPPVVTPVPDPNYPDPVPDQELTENPQESENPQQTENPIDTGKPWRLPDLKNKFPFCIPWDIGKIFTKLKINERQAPHISWRFNPPNTPIDYTFNLDLEDFEEVAALLRTLELMGFIVGLAFVTRYLIGAN